MKDEDYRVIKQANMFNYLISTFSNAMCSLLTFESSAISQLPEPLTGSSFTCIYASLLLFIFTTSMISFKLKTQINSFNKQCFFSFKQLVTFDKTTVCDGHNLAQKGKPPEASLDSHRFITFNTFLMKQKALGLLSRFQAPSSNLSEHQKARRAAYGLIQEDLKCYSIEAIATGNQLNMLRKTNNNTSSYAAPFILEKRSINCPLPSEQCSLFDLIRKAGKAKGIPSHPFEFSLLSQ